MQIFWWKLLGPAKVDTTLMNFTKLANVLPKKSTVRGSIKRSSWSNASFAFPNKNSFPGITNAFTPGASKFGASVIARVKFLDRSKKHPQPLQVYFQVDGF